MKAAIVWNMYADFCNYVVLCVIFCVPMYTIYYICNNPLNKK